MLLPDLRTLQQRKRHPVVNEESPVLPPSATPDDDSTKVVTVDVPHIAPTHVAIASDNIAFSKLGTCPSLSSKSPLAHAPYKVPRVSNISTIQKASAVVAIISTRSAVVWLERYPEKSKPCVNTLPNDIDAHSPNAVNGLSVIPSKNPS